MTDVYRVVFTRPDSLEEFRRAARGLIAASVPPENVEWTMGGEGELFEAQAPEGNAKPVIVPAAFARLAEDVVCHRDPERYALLYTLLWRIAEGERALLAIASDPLVHRLTRMSKAIHRDLHKMTAFVRFRRVEIEDGERFIA